MLYSTVNALLLLCLLTPGAPVGVLSAAPSLSTERELDVSAQSRESFLTATVSEAIDSQIARAVDSNIRKLAPGRKLTSWQLQLASPIHVCGLSALIAKAMAAGVSVEDVRKLLLSMLMLPDLPELAPEDPTSADNYSDVQSSWELDIAPDATACIMLRLCLVSLAESKLDQSTTGCFAAHGSGR